MKRYSILILSFALFLSACVKDRIQPAAVTPVLGSGDSLMYYWNFDNADSSQHGTSFTGAGLSGASFKAYCSYIDYTTGTLVNIQRNGTAGGSCLRVRNPSDSIIFTMPTTGYKNITLQFAEQRSSSGPSQNSVYYTTDGKNYISSGLANNAYLVDTTFGLHGFDFSADVNTNNNSKFAVKIIFNNNNTSTSGNDRFDNVSLFGEKQ